MKILFTGLHGLVGGHLSNLILKDIVNSGPFSNLSFFSINRNIENSHLSISSNIICEEIFICDCSDVNSMSNILQKIKPDLIVHIAQLKLTKFILKSINLSNIKKPKIIIIGTLGVFSNFQSCRNEYEEAELLINAYQNETLIIRSSMIYGSENDKNMHKLINLINKFKIIPLPSNGKSLFQPVFYQDISLAIFLSIKQFISKGILKKSIINLSGPNTLSLKEICLLISKRLYKDVFFINVDNDFICKILNFIESSNFKALPIKAEQFLRLNEDKVFSSEWGNNIFNIEPTSFEEGLDSQINCLFDRNSFNGNIIFNDSEKFGN